MDYLNNSSKFGWKLGLDRIRILLEVLGNPQDGVKFVHIAGTNGKGSTTAMLSSILMEAGYKVGMFTSPYIQCFEERVQVQGVNIPKEAVIKFMSLIKTAENKLDSELGDVTYFEIITALGFLYFKSEEIDVGVIEVGLGGRFDATNVIDPILTIITSISFDHTKILGDTLAKIAFEKAGIIKQDVPLVLYPQEEEADKVIAEIAQNRNAQVRKISESDVSIKEITKSSGKIKPSQCIKIESEKIEYEIPLIGVHQSLNSAVVVGAVNELNNMGFNIEARNIISGFKDVFWPGRMEMLCTDPRIVIDGAHNIDAIKKLKMNLRKYYEYDRLFLLVGMLSDKDVNEMIEILAGEAFEIVTLEPNNDRAQSREELCSMIQKHNDNVTTFECYEDGIKKVLSEAKKNDMILATGSFYLIGELRELILNKIG